MAVQAGWVGSSAKSETGKSNMADARVELRLPRSGWMSEMVGLSKEIRITTTGEIPNLNVFNLFGNPAEANAYVLVINHEIYSTSAGAAALTTGVFPAGSTLQIINNSFVRGAGGAGGAGGDAGGAGGTAILAQTPILLDNSRGNIWAGGGGGGNGGGAFSGGGGGAGRAVGAGARGSHGVGANGTYTTGGAGGLVFGIQYSGNGGSCGENGQSGVSGSPITAGGRGGYSIQGAANVTWLSGNNPTQVKGVQV